MEKPGKTMEIHVKTTIHQSGSMGLTQHTFLFSPKKKVIYLVGDGEFWIFLKAPLKRPIAVSLQTNFKGTMFG